MCAKASPRLHHGPVGIGWPIFTNAKSSTLCHASTTKRTAAGFAAVAEAATATCDSNGHGQQCVADFLLSLRIEQLGSVHFGNVENVGDLIDMRIDLGKVQHYALFRQRRGDPV